MTARTTKVRLPEALDDKIEALASSVRNESWHLHDIQEGIKEADAGEFATDEQVKGVFDKYGIRT